MLHQLYVSTNNAASWILKQARRYLQQKLLVPCP